MLILLLFSHFGVCFTINFFLLKFKYDQLCQKFVNFCSLASSAHCVQCDAILFYVIITIVRYLDYQMRKWEWGGDGN